MPQEYLIYHHHTVLLPIQQKVYRLLNRATTLKRVMLYLQTLHLLTTLISLGHKDLQEATEVKVPQVPQGRRETQEMSVRRVRRVPQGLTAQMDCKVHRVSKDRQEL